MRTKMPSNTFGCFLRIYRRHEKSINGLDSVYKAPQDGHFISKIIAWTRRRARGEGVIYRHQLKGFRPINTSLWPFYSDASVSDDGRLVAHEMYVHENTCP